jgi:AraC-like DNA-binding protein
VDEICLSGHAGGWPAERPTGAISIASRKMRYTPSARHYTAELRSYAILAAREELIAGRAMIHHLPANVGYILHEQAQSFAGAGAGLLSIKSFYNGEARYAVESRRFVVDDSSYFVLNNGQFYSIEIDADRRIESFCLFFAPGLVDDVRHRISNETDQLLIEPQSHTASPAFFERTYAHDQSVSPALMRLRAAVAHSHLDQSWLIEQFHLIMQRLLHKQMQVYREIDSLPAIRAATREELYRRVHYAREYAAALFTTPITLDDMARVAGMSPNHLLRTFKQIFDQTPYQYVIAKRIAYAQQLLGSTDQSVTDICFAVGFTSLGAFSWWFRQRVGVSPTTYRRLSDSEKPNHPRVAVKRET